MSKWTVEELVTRLRDQGMEIRQPNPDVLCFVLPGMTWLENRYVGGGYAYEGKYSWTLNTHSHRLPNRRCPTQVVLCATKSLDHVIKVVQRFLTRAQAYQEEAKAHFAAQERWRQKRKEAERQARDWATAQIESRNITLRRTDDGNWQFFSGSGDEYQGRVTAYDLDSFLQKIHGGLGKDQ